MISSFVIVKDRINEIEKCINSFKWCDEIIAVDTGSTDGTLELLQSRENIKVYQKEFTKEGRFNFSEARNYAISKCSYDWIFFLDSDEYLEEKYFNEVKNLTTLEADAWELIQYSKTENPDYILSPTLRLFKAGIQFELEVHETLMFDMKRKGYKLGKCNIPLMHTGYVKGDHNYKVPETHPLSDYYNANGDVEKLEKLMSETLNPNFKSYILLMLAEHYSNEGMVYRAIRLCKESIRLIEKQSLGYMMLSMIYFKVGMIDEAISQIEILVNRKGKIDCWMFNDRYYTPDTLKHSLSELLAVRMQEIEYLTNLNKETK